VTIWEKRGVVVEFSWFSSILRLFVMLSSYRMSVWIVQTTTTYSAVWCVQLSDCLSSFDRFVLWVFDRRHDDGSTDWSHPPLPRGQCWRGFCPGYPLYWAPC